MWFFGLLILLEKVVFKYLSKILFIIDDINLNIGMGDCIGILGFNGFGKFIFIKVLVG